MAVERTVRVSSKGRIVVPKMLRDKLGISPGDCLVVETRSDCALVVRKSEGNLSSTGPRSKQDESQE